MVLEGENFSCPEMENDIILFFKRSQDEYHVIIYDFSPLKHLANHSFNYLFKDFLYKGTEYNFFCII